jgi:hypothetical protein
MIEPPEDGSEETGGQVSKRPPRPDSASERVERTHDAQSENREDALNISVVRGLAWNTPFPPSEFIQGFASIRKRLPEAAI